MRAFVQLWDEVTRDRYGVQDPKQRRFRYGVQVNSLGLTEAQPENNVQRIVLEMLAVTLSRTPGPGPCSFPAWNEALGLPRPWDQQWSLRMMQQCWRSSPTCSSTTTCSPGSAVVEAKVADLAAGRPAEMARIEEMGGAVAAVESGYMNPPSSPRTPCRRQRIEAGQDVVVGVNRFETTEPNPLTADLDAAIQSVDPEVEARAAEAVGRWREARDRRAGRPAAGAEAALAGCARRRAPAPTSWPNPECARAGVTTGEWAGALREVFGEYRAPTGVSAPWASEGRATRRWRRSASGCARRPGARRAAARPGRQAGLTATATGRAGGRAGARRRFRGRLPGHPADAAADRRCCVARTCTSSASRSCPARTWSWCPRSCAGLREAGAARCPSWSAASSPTPTRGRCAQGVAAVFTPRTSGSPRSWRDGRRDPARPRPGHWTAVPA